MPVEERVAAIFCAMMPAGAAPSNPPDPPGHTRNDDANTITVYSEDRKGGGATIIYHGNGCDVTGLAAKPGGVLPPHVRVAGSNLIITDTGVEGTGYKYHVTATAAAVYGGKHLQTDDPQIHNGGA